MIDKKVYLLLTPTKNSITPICVGVGINRLFVYHIISWMTKNVAVPLPTIIAPQWG
jgi:hypothetical protein